MPILKIAKIFIFRIWQKHFSISKRRMAVHNKIGEVGEALARKYLEQQGYTILEQNYRTRYAEIDLVAQRDKTCVFVEVRTKIGEQFGSPEDTINKKKLWKMRKNAEVYVARVRQADLARIDAICVVLEQDFTQRRLTHYENIA